MIQAPSTPRTSATRKSVAARPAATVSAAREPARNVCRSITISGAATATVDAANPADDASPARRYSPTSTSSTLDIGRNVADMRMPRKRLDSGTWGVMGMGYTIGAAVVSGIYVMAVRQII
jgi:oxalyl-CoA decarboxylase